MIRTQDRPAFVIKIGGSEAIDEKTGVNPEAMTLFLNTLCPVLGECFLNPRMDGRGAFVIGGGKRSRAAIKDLTSEEEKDTVGMRCTHEHADQLRALATDVGIPMHEVIPKNPQELQFQMSWARHTMALGGIQPGQTTDAVAFMAAQELREAKYNPRIVITSDVGSIFTDNPSVNSTARSIVSTTIQDLLEQHILVADLSEYHSGMHTPIDPKAVQLLMQLHATVFFTTMADTLNIERFLAGRPVESGTMIGPDLPFRTR